MGMKVTASPFRLFVACLILMMTSFVWAEGHEGGGEEGDKKEGEGSAGEQYVEIFPSLVVNYGGPGRLKYLKLDLSIRVADVESAEQVKHHMPFVRNNLLMLFAKQTEETIGTVEGKELLRQTALEEVRKVISDMDGFQGVEDLLYTNFIVQR